MISICVAGYNQVSIARQLWSLSSIVDDVTCTFVVYKLTARSQKVKLTKRHKNSTRNQKGLKVSKGSLLIC